MESSLERRLFICSGVLRERQFWGNFASCSYMRTSEEIYRWVRYFDDNSTRCRIQGWSGANAASVQKHHCSSPVSSSTQISIRNMTVPKWERFVLEITHRLLKRGTHRSWTFLAVSFQQEPLESVYDVWRYAVLCLFKLCAERSERNSYHSSWLVSRESLIINIY